MNPERSLTRVYKWTSNLKGNCQQHALPEAAPGNLRDLHHAGSWTGPPAHWLLEKRDLKASNVCSEQHLAKKMESSAPD